MLNKKLEKRLKDLEEFLGLIYTTDPDNYSDYYYRVSSYGDFKPQGILSELKQDLAKRQEKERKPDEKV